MPREPKPHLCNGHWRCTIRGTPYWFGKDKRRAFAEFHRLMREQFKLPTTGRPETVNGLIAAWLRLNDKPAYRQWLCSFRDFAGSELLDDIGADLLVRYQVYLAGRRYTRGKSRKQRKLTAETVRHYIRTATSALRWGVKQKWLAEMPDVPKLPSPSRQNRDIDHDLLAATFEALDGRSKRAGRLLRFILATGCRPSEACGLTWKDVHVDRRICLLANHKTAEKSGKPRTVYLTDDAIEVLSELAPQPGPVFTNRFGQPYKPNGLRSILKRAPARAAKALRLRAEKHNDPDAATLAERLTQVAADGGFTPYQLRHTYAQTGSESGVAIDVLATLLGHSNTRTTSFYYEVRDQRAADAAQAIRIRLSSAKTNAS